MKEAATLAERIVPSDEKAHEAFRKKRLEMAAMVQNLEQGLKQQSENYKLEAATRRGMDKVPLALKYGLALEAQDILLKMKVDNLKAEDQAQRARWLTQIMLKLGQASALTPEL